MKSFLILIALIASARGAPLKLPRFPLHQLLRTDNRFESKIIGGTIIEQHEFPFSVSFQKRGLAWAHSCGGVIYNERIVITAAQCLDGVANLANVRIAAAEWSFAETSGEEQIRGVTSYLVHENYNFDTFDNDIALIEVNVPFDFGSGTVFPVSLPTQGQEYLDGTNVTTVGWGHIVSGGVTSDKPRKASTVILNDTACDALYGGGLVRPPMLCAWVPEGGKGPCQGDVGAPLFIGNTYPLLVGLVSWSYRCAVAGYPAVHTQVSYYMDWIKDNLDGNYIIRH